MYTQTVVDPILCRGSHYTEFCVTSGQELLPVSDG
jgi:hypothetical protein